MSYTCPCAKSRLRSVGGVFIFVPVAPLESTTWNLFFTAIPSLRVSLLECAVPSTLRLCTTLVQISPLDSALTDTPSVTHLESALTKKGEGGRRWPCGTRRLV